MKPLYVTIAMWDINFCASLRLNMTSDDISWHSVACQIQDYLCKKTDRNYISISDIHDILSDHDYDMKTFYDDPEEYTQHYQYHWDGMTYEIRVSFSEHHKHSFCDTLDIIENISVPVLYKGEEPITVLSLYRNEDLKSGVLSAFRQHKLLHDDAVACSDNILNLQNSMVVSVTVKDLENMVYPVAIDEETLDHNFQIRMIDKATIKELFDLDFNYYHSYLKVK